MQMQQLSFNFLEQQTEIEFSKIKGVWDACRYAKEHDPCPGIKYYGDYYVPQTIQEMKQILTKMYPFSRRLIKQMTKKQASMIYHAINKFLSCSNFFKEQ